MKIYTKHKRNIKQEDPNLPHSIWEKFIEELIFGQTHNVKLKVTDRIGIKQREFKLNKTEMQNAKELKRCGFKF